MPALVDSARIMVEGKVAFIMPSLSNSGALYN
ncbi:hypothetical protein ABIF64_002571 [Bradyrhizobium japonicum]|nr:hypothetical protein [Bradyrhizobium japonicum]MCP1804152.1 hypothetical protein [Bradyrhizobium japonicum]MCP1813174.1 hypothetical protein [Bradyrhizobium japonicum]MCS4000106.1 hypothetical protein [Bradyrhizobium japonicum]